MSDLEEVVDRFSGFLTKSQVEDLLKDGSYNQLNALNNAKKANYNVKELLKYIGSTKPQEANALSSNAIEAQRINVRDRIYRIFNPQITNIKGTETPRRTIILGEEGSTVALSLREKLSDLIDMNAFERGDTVMVSNVVLAAENAEIRPTQSTVINKMSPSRFGVVNDYSRINEEMRRVDVIGRTLEISPIRHVSRLGNGGQIAVASCVMTDSVNVIDASFWGSSAMATTPMRANEVIKIEFCDIRMRDGRFQVYANDDSRVATNNLFARRMHADAAKK
jgi:hypothetical protein